VGKDKRAGKCQIVGFHLRAIEQGRRRACGLEREQFGTRRGDPER
jgi:hypothetical protein